MVVLPVVPVVVLLPVVPARLMSRLLTSNGNGHQTVINTLAWAQNHAREATYTRLSKYYGRNGEDVIV